MIEWRESRPEPSVNIPIGQFTGSTGVRVLTQAELASGQQAWARKVSAIAVESKTAFFLTNLVCHTFVLFISFLYLNLLFLIYDMILIIGHIFYLKKLVVMHCITINYYQCHEKDYNEDTKLL